MIIKAKVTNHLYRLEVTNIEKTNNGYSAFGRRWIKTKNEWAKSRWFHFNEYEIIEE